MPHAACSSPLNRFAASFDARAVHTVLCEFSDNTTVQLGLWKCEWAGPRRRGPPPCANAVMCVPAIHRLSRRARAALRKPGHAGCETGQCKSPDLNDTTLVDRRNIQFRVSPARQRGALTLRSSHHHTICFSVRGGESERVRSRQPSCPHALMPSLAATARVWVPTPLLPLPLLAGQLGQQADNCCCLDVTCGAGSAVWRERSNCRRGEHVASFREHPVSSLLPVGACLQSGRKSTGIVAASNTQQRRL